MTYPDNLEHTENLEFNWEREKNDQRAILTSRPRLKAPTPRKIRPPLNLVPVNLKHKAKIATPTKSPGIKVEVEHHNDDVPSNVVLEEVKPPHHWIENR